ncbi:MAG: hypothetical protein Q9219_001924 [cf. Caloplaca sp. 3 TL-2023]
MQFTPDGSQPSSAPAQPPIQEGASSQSLGKNPPNVSSPFNNQGPTLPPIQHRENGFVSLPQHAFPSQQQQLQPVSQHPEEAPLPILSSSAPDYGHVNEDFHPYDPTDQPEVANNKSPPKGAASADSPDGRPASNGRRRTRTKVVAWDPRDLEDIYERKEILKEDWDSICRVILTCSSTLMLSTYLTQDYPTRTRVAMRQQVIKLREKKQRARAGLSHKTGKGSTYSGSPQPMPSSNGIRWATVNGSSPANNDPYQRRQSFDDEGSSEEYNSLSSPPDSDHEGKSTKHVDHSSRSTPQQPQVHSIAELAPQQPGVSSMPVIIQEAPQTNTPAQSTFDVVAAQSKGKPIAPRQPLPPTPLSMPLAPVDDRQPPPPPPPEFRATQRIKRGREAETTGSESRSSSNLGKRRKQHAEQDGAPAPMVSNVSGYGHRFNAAPPYPEAPQIPTFPPESSLEDLWTRFGVMHHMLKTACEEDQRRKEDQHRIRTEIYEASLRRANARAVYAEQKADEASQMYADQMKDDRLATRLEFENLSQEAENHRAEAKRWKDEHNKVYEELQASITDQTDRDARERALEAKFQESQRIIHLQSQLPGMEASRSNSKQDVERANAANDLLAEEVAKMQMDRAEILRKFEEIKAEHADLTVTLDNIVSQDLDDLTHKIIKKHVLDVKGVDDRLTAKIKEAAAFLEQYAHVTSTTSGSVNQSTNSNANGFVPGEKH